MLLNIAFSKQFYNDKSIMNVNWGPDNGQNGFYIRFKENNKYEILQIGDGAHNHSNGKFRLEGNKLFLLDNVINIEMPYIIENNLNSVFSKECIRYIGNKKIDKNINIFWNIKNTVYEGEERLFNNMNVIIIHKNAVINSNDVYLRDQPTIESNKYKINIQAQNYVELFEDKLFQQFLPKQYNVKTICKTKTKFKINDKINYWYYIDIHHVGYIPLKYDEYIYNIKYNYVWIFGEYITLQ